MTKSKVIQYFDPRQKVLHFYAFRKNFSLFFHSSSKSIHTYCRFTIFVVPLHFIEFCLYKYIIIIMSRKNFYQTPATEVCRVKMESHVLDASQSWPAGAPANAQRNGYGEAEEGVWM